METRYRELLELHRTKFVQLVEVERLYPILHGGSDGLSPTDIAEINKHSSREDKVEKLLSMLPSKGNLAFQSLCLALETTYPHLLTVMFLGSSHRLAPDQRSTMSDSEEDSVRRPILQDSSSQEFRDHWKPGAVISTVQFEPHLENFHASADHHNQSSTKDIQSSFSRFTKDSLKPEQSKNYEWLRSQCEHAINELQSMKQQYAETMKRCDQAVKEAEHYRGQNKSLLSKLSKISEDKKMVESQNNEFSSIKQRLEHEIDRLQQLREEDKQEMEEMRKQQRKVVNSSGSNEVLNEMYDTAMQRYDTLKRDYDALRERCEQTSATEITTENQMEILTEENLRLKKRCDELSKENSTILSESDGIKQQCTSAIRNWNKALHENKALKEAQLMAQKQRDDLRVEIHQSLAKQIGMKKEVENIIHDRDNSRKEYQLVMSERDVVHKEIEQLHEKLKIASQKVELLEKNKRETENEVETLRREIRSALQERDKANKERNDICGRKQELEHERDEFWKEFDSMARERDIAKKERHEALEHIDMIIKETYEKSQKEKAEEINNASKETEILRKQMEKMKQDLSDSFSEADIAKKRRDWAFSERDKIVQERESIRTLCDNLRRDRDRAVSALAQALRDSDEIKKQKNEAFKELKDVKERFEVIVEKETRKTQLNSIGHNHSRDSAIDADLQEWEMETLDIDLQSVEGEEIGVELTGGKDDPQFTNDTSVYVSHITKGSIADGKLKVNDTVLKVNNIDVSNIEKRVAVRAMHKSTGRLNMVVRRRKSTSARIWQPLQLLLSCQKECGIHIEQGLFICGVYTGGIIAKDGMLPSVGDRIIHINGKSADSLTAREAMKLLEKSTEPVQLDVRRQASPISSTGSSPTPISQSVISSLAEQPASKMSKSESLPSHGSHWDTSLDGIQGTGSKILRSSGSQTDSLDSIGPVRRHKERNPDTEKSRHSVHVIGKAFEKIFRPRNHAHDKNSDGEEKTHKKVNSKGRSENVIAEFGPVYEKEEGKEIKRKRSHEGEQESNSGTWPKTRGQHMINMSGAATVIMPQKRTKERPSIRNIQFDPIPDHPMTNDLQNTSMSSDGRVSKHETMPWDFEELPPYIPVSSLPPPTNIVNTKDKPYIPYGTFSNNHYSKNLSTHPSSDIYNLPSYADKPARLRPSSGTHKNNPQNRHSALPSHHSNGHHIREFRPVSAEVTSLKRIVDIPPDKLSASTNFVENSIPSHSNRMVGRPNSFQHTSASTHSQSVWCNNVTTSPTTSGYYRPSHHIVSPRSDFDLEKLPFNFDRLSTPSPSQHSSINLDRTTPTPSDDMFPKAHSISPYGGRPLSEIDFNTSYPTFHKRPLALERIRIPSNTSVATKSGSVEIVSDRSSASSPLFVFPHEEYSRSRKPQLREIRTIHIEKSAEPVGFQIQRGPEGGIFVSSVGENSLASDAGIVVGDQLLEVCGINMRNATYEHAVTVLRQCGNNLTMKVDFNPDKYRDHPESSSNGSLSSVPNSSGFSSPLSDNENSPKTRHTSGHNRRKKSSFGSVDSANLPPLLASVFRTSYP
ncbi:disks large homolog 5 [Patella vulgata]|uniref:disks large homolog 5 n=1 Tax=Patella vulgata TaxID=6465 RepID=UPI0024A9296B|nr:disks large homolog 5 [Patella vulgata]